MHDFTKLEIWRMAVRLAPRVAGAIPISSGRRAPGLRAQVLRAAQRVGDAIAEGCGKNSDFELARFAEIAGGSAAEVQSQLGYALGYGIISGDVFKKLWADYRLLRSRINAFHRVVRRRAEQDAARAKQKARSRRKEPKRQLPKAPKGRPKADPPE